MFDKAPRAWQSLAVACAALTGHFMGASARSVSPSLIPPPHTPQMMAAEDPSDVKAAMGDKYYLAPEGARCGGLEGMFALFGPFWFFFANGWRVCLLVEGRLLSFHLPAPLFSLGVRRPKRPKHAQKY